MANNIKNQNDDKVFRKVIINWYIPTNGKNSQTL